MSNGWSDSECEIERNGTYIDGLNGMQISLSNSQVGPSTAVKQEQEDISHNREALYSISVYQGNFSCQSKFRWPLVPSQPLSTDWKPDLASLKSTSLNGQAPCAEDDEGGGSGAAERVLQGCE